MLMLNDPVGSVADPDSSFILTSDIDKTREDLHFEGNMIFFYSMTHSGSLHLFAFRINRGIHINELNAFRLTYLYWISLPIKWIKTMTDSQLFIRIGFLLC